MARKPCGKPGELGLSFGATLLQFGVPALARCGRRRHALGTAERLNDHPRGRAHLQW